jgi:GGDEF domain-containing protein
VSRIRATLEESNSSRKSPFRLTASVGAAVFDPARDVSAEAFLHRLDVLMYEDKNAKKPPQITT